MKPSKIAIFGVGNVGATIAYTLMLQNIAAEILLVDANVARCQGEFLDLEDVLPFCSTSKIKNATLQQAAQSDIIIITAGAAQKPGQTRLELFSTNKNIMDSIIKYLKPLNPQAIIIVVSNPVDLLTLHIQNKHILPRSHIFGSGTFLDTQRLKFAIAHKFDIAPQTITTYILGEHGDTQFPAWSSTECAEKSILSVPNIDQTQLDTLAQEAKNKAYEIITCKGYTNYGISTCVAALCQSIICNQKQVFPVSCYVSEFDVCLSMPCIISQKGIEKIYPLSLNDQEKKLLQISAEALHTIAQKL